MKGLKKKLRELRQLRKDAKRGKVAVRSCGICMNTGEFSEDELHSLFVRWPKFSGNKEYPVPHPEGYPEMDGSTPARDAAFAYGGHHNKWEGKYGALRMELLDFMIEELEKLEDGEHN